MSRKSIKLKCKNCSKYFYPHWSSEGIYCSIKCQHEFQNGLLIEKWLKDKINPINTNGLLRPWARRHLFSVYKNKCCQCGWGETNHSTGLIPLEVDHIDGNYKNNNMSNLRLLCPNCHSLTATYKNSNKGNGRKRR